jgi:HEAT repeat protein
MDDADEWEAIRRDLRTAGVDPTDLGRFVNRPNPDIRGLEPERFDAKAAYPVLLAWLPRARSPRLRATIASRLREAGKSSETARALIRAFRAESDEVVRWELGDAIARSATRAEFDDIVELAGDRSSGSARQMLVDALWRVKTDRARALILELKDDPDVCRHAMSALRRAFGNEEARPTIEPLLDHPHETVRMVARDTLKRIDKALAR